MNAYNIAAQPPAARRAFLHYVADTHELFDPSVRVDLVEQCTPELNDTPTRRVRLYAALRGEIQGLNCLKGLDGVPNGFESREEYELAVDGYAREVDHFLSLMVPDVTVLAGVA